MRVHPDSTGRRRSVRWLCRRRGHLASVLGMCLLSATAVLAGDYERLKYNNPGLVVDLGVGLWAWPLPMDYDGDGDMDLVVSCTDKPYSGTYFFENPGQGGPMPVFRPAVRIGPGISNAQVSYVDGEPRVFSCNVELTAFRQGDLGKRTTIYPKANVHANRVRANQWRTVDYDADGRLDLAVGVGDWTEYGWDNGYDERGEWTRGPLRGFVYLIRNTGTRAEPDYETPVRVRAGDGVVDVYGMPSPSFADFDGDGDLDLMCGEFVDRFTYFENTGTRTDPRYAAGRFVSHGDSPLRMDLCMIVPVAVDWDRDGDVDLVVGQEDGRVALVEHTGRIADGVPVFEPPRFFRQIADNVKFGALVTPVSVDWDADGDQDLVCGNTAGYVGFVENLDGGDPPSWAAPVLLQANGKAIRIMAGPNGSIQGPCEAKWGYSTLSVADWDHDGLLDLVVNSILGTVVWFRNTGSAQAPAFADGCPVEVDWPGPPPKPSWRWRHPGPCELSTQWRTTPVVADVTGDGLNDLAMLDHEGYLALFERVRRGDRLTLLPGKRLFMDHRGQPLRLNAGEAGRSGRRKLCLADWNQDGRLDLLANSRSVDYLENVSQEAGGFTFVNRGRLGERILAGHTTSPTTVDWNADGTPDLLVGAEDGHFYLLRHEAPPPPVPLPPRKEPVHHLVAAWDFEEGDGGPLADKAASGRVQDRLGRLGSVRIAKGVAEVAAERGSALVAVSSPDLSPRAELTIWLRVRLTRNPVSYVSLVDKRRFLGPESRSYGLYATPDAANPEAYGIGGQVSGDGTGGQALTSAGGAEAIPVGRWSGVAMTVRRDGPRLMAEWFARADDQAPASRWQRLSRSHENVYIDTIHASDEPLLIGNDANLNANSSPVVLDEVRLYDRALTLEELASLVPRTGRDR